ncbi:MULTISPECIES: PKD domain-containing protein [Halomicrobium]|uniref:PKD domain containing protein n=1 Tax=Halomicrobium mukohataei (strain ATCC 700874 / DSM 12286 / JCM 9738 / NCIMB 13541) TaxID=485914 RepID=C7P0N1_HALMD|nr:MULTISPECIES: PKD domain-containing protein [Halomicrobium]ACV47013.1 PKD domain containing protein [Halomicrobium mukohataei DSM 12286]
MDNSRREFIRAVSSTFVLAAGAGTTVAATDCGNVAEWDPDATYNGGDQVTYEGSLWTAEWWTRGSAPEESKAVWTLEGSCGGDGGTGNEGPTASVSASATTVEPGTTVDLDGSGSSDADGSIASYEWELGDGTTATGATTSHSYDSTGDYTVTLTVTDDGGATDSATTGISVSSSSGGNSDAIFSPYLGTWGDILGDTRNASTDRVVLSFVGDGTDDGTVTPAWLTADGDRPLSDHADKISTLQDEGYDVWVAMGGWDGRIVARDASSVSEVKSAYETVIDTLGVTHIDIDDENYDEPGRDGTYYEMRNEALAQIQSERPDVKVTYTVAARPSGIVNADHCPGKDMITDALEKGVELEYINIMTMDWTDVDTTPERVKSAVEGTVDWMSNVYPDKSEAQRRAKLGFLPNVNESEWSVSDTQNVADYAKQQGIGNVSMWALHRDTSDYGHSDALYPVESGSN